MMSPSDREKMKELEILKRAQHNDQKAFTEIFKQYKSYIFHEVYEIVQDFTVAEDLTMITFEKVFRNIKKFVPNYKLSTWMVKIGRNVAIDYVRRQSIKPRSTELVNTIPNYYTPEEELIIKEREKILETAVTHLNGNYKKIMTMKIEGDKKCREIADELNVPLNTVVGYVRVGRKKILLEQEKVNRIKIPNPKDDKKTFR